MLFAHPFIENPEAQIDKNRLSKEKSSYKHYTQKNVGQIFVCEKKRELLVISVVTVKYWEQSR